jgi:hypothetical protein
MLLTINQNDQGVLVQELCSQVNPSKIRVSEQIIEGIYLGNQTANILSPNEQRTFYVRFVARIATNLLLVLRGESPIASCSEHLSLSVRNKVSKLIGSRDFENPIIQRIHTQTSAIGILKSTVIVSSVDLAHTLSLIMFTKLAFSKPMVVYFDIA